ncbi:gamma-glutamylcyclotransferase [Shewanella surugensis]|uniref:glutathione-specific gamma-glutamylcyclotransferase n=1 Tax=Shewanella surugensis TaxID=212020 RepID=A0ABT0LI09_9GAMM|nr:gamma-glutamylcyclotransferase [Shewanella surugensis]MCL1127342.1 gamma-glutamylcyclotransferase [Shewanella surugensis]
MSKKKKWALTRDTLKSQPLPEWLQERIDSGELSLLDEEARQALLEQTLSSYLKDQPLWIFAYGSLMWNPTFHFDQVEPCTLDGFHRKFCIRDVIARGTSAVPALMLGIEEGGKCEGLGYQIPVGEVKNELELLWNREMLTGVYVPTWVEIITSSKEVLPALTFTMNKSHDNYLPGLSRAQVSHSLGIASGPLGQNSDYLFQLVDRLSELGIHDVAMSELKQALGK